jgi:predicted enzyme related to lactoylglutathione lyase
VNPRLLAEKNVKAASFGTLVGRMALIGDPQGAVFSVIQLASQPA